MSVTVSPHGFRPVRPWDALHGNGRCRRCYIPRNAHPIHFWANARPLGDKRPAELSFEVLSGQRAPAKTKERPS